MVLYPYKNALLACDQNRREAKQTERSFKKQEVIVRGEAVDVLFEGLWEWRGWWV